MSFFKDIKYAFAALAVISCEMAFGKYMDISGVIPMLTFCFCVITAMVEDDFSYIMIFSLILGLVSDLLSGHGIGTYMLSFMFAAYITGRFRDSVFSSSIVFLIIDVFMLTVLVQIFYMLVHIGDIGAGHFFAKIKSIVVPQALYNTVICLIAYPIVSRLSGKRR